MQKPNRIIHIIMCALNLGSVFYALMVGSVGTPFYSFFRGLSLAFSMPLLFMRSIYLQYIIFGVIAIITLLSYIKSIKNKTLIKRTILIDVLLWGITIVELIYLENAFEAILWF